MVPHGDRRDGSQSGSVKDEEAIRRPRHNDVVSVLVLRQNLSDAARWILTPKPVKDIPERPFGTQLISEPRRFGLWDRGISGNRNISHGKDAVGVCLTGGVRLRGSIIDAAASAASKPLPKSGPCSSNAGLGGTALRT